ncbi:hypothetical protein [Costertonia aggregata]|uniref:Uncharacterized protein n=1 Tax=Costertonia aggregata TaxID=343403 RepID=A0A7H9APS8_9FLAO|nr:hypothetical protein [Costertonia aggregata]QLG45424.1 hypothetical protein HYG79_08710 [Costertonia aggregata]
MSRITTGKYGFALLLFIFPLILSAQKNYREGYVVLNNHDTIYGMVADRKEGAFATLYDRIRFKGKKKKRKYAPKQISAYKIGEKLYHSVWFDRSDNPFNGKVYIAPDKGEKVFLWVRETGPVTRYIYELQDQGESLIWEVNYFLREGDTYMIRADQGVFGLKRKRLIRFFSDCPPLVQKLSNNEIKHASEVALFYNDWKMNQ